MAKDELRQVMRLKRNELSQPDRAALSDAIACRLCTTQAYRDARSIMLYFTHGSEASTDALMKQAIKEGKTILAPVVNREKEREMFAAEIRCWETDVAPGAFCVPEPRAEYCRRFEPGAIDLVIVPGLAFDLYGHRLGYGKGYYDTWLTQFQREQCIGLAYDFQVVNILPKEQNDVPVGSIITDQRLIVTLPA